jgi:hypothetical protein
MGKQRKILENVAKNVIVKLAHCYAIFIRKFLSNFAHIFQRKFLKSSKVCIFTPIDFCQQLRKVQFCAAKMETSDMSELVDKQECFV